MRLSEPVSIINFKHNLSGPKSNTVDVGPTLQLIGDNPTTVNLDPPSEVGQISGSESDLHSGLPSARAIDR